jgi:ActR/RegA family two-component response regulator
MSRNASVLAGKLVLVVEDEYFVADDLRQALVRRGADVVGPVARVEAGLPLAETAGLAAAILDVNLAGDMSFPIADRLIARGVPFVLATGYDDTALPDRFAPIGRMPKPFSPDIAVAMLERLVDGRGAE